MIGEAFEGDSNLQPLDAVLGDLGRAIEALRDLLRHRQRERRRDAAQDAPGWVPASAGPGGDALSSVEEVLSIPAAGSEPQELFTLATDRICRLLGADRVMLFAAEGGHLRPRSARGFRRDDLDSIVVEAGDGIVGRTFTARRALTASGIAALDDAFIERFPVKEAIAVPVRAEDDVVGVLYAGRRADGRPFGPSDVLLLLVIADRMGSAFVHQSLLDRRSVSIARLAELAELAGEAPLGRDLTDILSRAAEVACRLVGVRAAAVAVGVEDLEVVAARGLPRGPDSWRSISRREGLTAELYARDGPIACRDVQTKPGAERSFLGDGGFHGCLLVPLKLRGLTLGVLYLADTEVRDFSVEDIAVSRVLAAMSASVIENSRVHAVLASRLETARAAQDQQLEAEKVRSLAEVGGGIAREFNQIFAVILGKSQLLLARATDESLREGLGVIEEAAWRGADVVHRVGSLAVPAVEAAGDATDMKALVEDAVALARTRWKDDGGGQRRHRGRRGSRGRLPCARRPVGAAGRRGASRAQCARRHAGRRTTGAHAPAAGRRRRAGGGRHRGGNRRGGQAANVRSVLHDARAGADGARAHHGPERGHPVRRPRRRRPGHGRPRHRGERVAARVIRRGAGLGPEGNRDPGRARRGEPVRRPPDRSRGAFRPRAPCRDPRRARPFSCSRTRSRCARCSSRP